MLSCDWPACSNLTGDLTGHMLPTGYGSNGDDQFRETETISAATGCRSRMSRATPGIETAKIQKKYIISGKHSICLSILTNLTLSRTLSERTIWQTPRIDFLSNPLEEVQSFKLLVLTISHDLSLANHISTLASKTSLQSH